MTSSAQCPDTAEAEHSHHAPHHERGARSRLDAWVHGAAFQSFITFAIVANAVILGLETARSLDPGALAVLRAADRVFVGLFAAEIGLKMALRRFAFFRSAWNVFDFAVVAISLVPAAGPLSVLRALRVIRALRLFSMVPAMRLVVESLVRAIPGLGSIGALLALVFYVSAVLATSLFGETFPQWFGTLGASLYSLFQIMTLESWSMGIVRPVMETHPHAWVFFVPFILLTTFTVLNLFIGVIVEAIQSQQKSIVESVAADAARLSVMETESIVGRIERLQHELSQLSRDLRCRNLRESGPAQETMPQSVSAAPASAATRKANQRQHLPQHAP